METTEITKEIDILISKKPTKYNDTLKLFGLTNSENFIPEDEYIKSLRLQYPNHKIISPKVVNYILKKYNLLLCDNLKKFIGKIPDNCLEDLSNFINKYGTIREYYYFSANDWYSNIVVNKLQYDNIIKNNKKTILGKVRINEINYTPTKNTAEREFQIMAPFSQLDLSDRDVIVNNVVINTDPIILEYVNGYYIIITAWDIEAKDPQIFNERNN